ncbi:MAG: hypothetical protein M5U28_41395 [Sandaracinaceae bacterium]|nr:hypothetical protein [Sandaracinaceae bacterium]
MTVNATAVAPPAGTLFPLANVAHTSGTLGTPGPASVAQMGAVRGVAVASDGTVYVADATYRVVRAISPAGEMSIVAGGRACPARPATAAPRPWPSSPRRAASRSTRPRACSTSPTKAPTASAA